MRVGEQRVFRKLNVGPHGERAAVRNDLLRFLRKQEIDELLGRREVRRSLDDRDRARKHDDFLRIDEAERGALLYLVRRDVVHADAGEKVAHRRIIDDLAGPLAHLRLVLLAVLEELPAERLHERRDAAVGRSRKRRVRDAERALELGLQEILPGCRRGLDETRVVRDRERSVPCGGEEPLGLLHGALDELRFRGDVGLQDAFLLELVEIGNLAVPEHVDRHLARLALGGDLRHELSRSGGVIVEVDTRVVLDERFLERADERLLHRRVHRELLCGHRNAGNAENGQQNQDCQKFSHLQQPPSNVACRRQFRPHSHNDISTARRITHSSYRPQTTPGLQDIRTSRAL